MRRIIATIVFWAVASFAIAPSASWAKTNKECNAEWKANKSAIKATKEKKKYFMTACKAGTETIPPAATSNAPPAAPRAQTPVAPRARVAAPTSRGVPTKANEFTTEGTAKARCPSGTVVWVNTRSGVYHYAGTHNYGTTKSGVYMCETDTGTAGFRAAKNEHHP